MKICVIGGGSTYTPELIEGFIQKSEELGLDHVALMDIDPERLDVVGDFCRRMVEASGTPFDLSLSSSTEDAMADASFILTQFRVGGQEARHKDIMLGLRHELIGQETTGVGGMAKALRTIPVIMDMCAKVESIAPEAWIINFTNPSGIITQTILNHGKRKAIGLCNVPIDMKMSIAKHLGVHESELEMESVGLNHLGWVRRVLLNGEDITGTLLKVLAGADGPKNIPDMDFPPELLKSLGAIPLYYNRFFYLTEEILKGLKTRPKSRAEEVMEIEAALLRQYRDKKLSTKPKELDERGGAYYSKIAIELVDALVNDRGTVHTVNVQNRGAIRELPEDAVVEIPARIGKEGASPIPVDPLEPSIRSLIRQVKTYEELTIEAALNSSRSAAFRALITNPLGPRAENATKVLDDLLKTNGLHDLYR